MRKKTKALALSGVLTGLTLVLLIVGSITGIGTYAAPMLGGIALMPVGMTMDRKWHVLAWIASSLLSFMLLTDREEALVFAFIFGWYPIARPWLDSFKRPLNAIFKFAALNVCTVSVEALVMLVLIPETESTLMLLALLLMANVIFFVYDRLIPRMELVIRYRLLKKLGF